MRRLCFGVALVAMASLALEIMLTRVFDVILAPNMAYFVVTAAIFGFGLAGIAASLRPLPSDAHFTKRLTLLAAGLGIASCVLVPLINVLNLDYFQIRLDFRAPTGTILASYMVLYAALLAPFFVTGYLLILIFSKYAKQIQELYFWDLCGAGIGTLAVIPFVPMIGPGGLVMCAGALAFIAAALFSESRRSRYGLVTAAIAAFAVPLAYYPAYFDVEDQLDKRGVKQAAAAGDIEVTIWDPISKVQVVDMTSSDKRDADWRWADNRKHIAYDGGNQSSYFFPFDGDYERLRRKIEEDRSRAGEDFWQLAVLASHHLKRDSKASVLIIGSAGGQETKAAITYGASRVQAIELVRAVVELGKGQYSSYIGEVFNHPTVDVRAEEGRSFLRRSQEKYDIIQIFSTHTSSSIAMGTGAIQPKYLQTAEAYEEYFSRLADDGVLHINHQYYPRMVTTAAKAWRDMGRKDFQKHVVVFDSPAHEALSTFLVKMTPWTVEEVKELSEFLSPPEFGPDRTYTLVENPLNPEKSFLSSDFYSGSFSRALDQSIPLRYSPSTDDKPYFKMVRKEIKYLEPDDKVFVTAGIANMVNRQLLKGVIPMDVAHLILVSAMSVFFVLLFVFVPLKFSVVGRQQGPRVMPVIGYFSCLGAGFIIIELIYIQKFMQLIGSPLYTYSSVIFTMLVAAGIGSLSSGRLGISPNRLWQLPFAAIVLFGGAMLVCLDWLFDFGLAFGQVGRVAFASLLMFPVGFFLGMCLPLGVLAIESRPPGAIAWAWGMNGVFTVVGGIGSVFLSLAFGLTFALSFALALYVLAFFIFPYMRDGTASIAESSRA